MRDEPEFSPLRIRGDERGVFTLLFLCVLFLGCADLRPKQTAEGKWGYVDRDGKFAIAAQFDAAYKFHDGLARVGVMTSVVKPSTIPYGLGYYVDQMKYGFIDSTGAFIAKPVYDFAEDFKDGRAWVGRDEAGWSGGAQFITRHYGYLDHGGTFTESKQQ